MGQQFTITLPDDVAEMVKAKVAAGEFASVDAVVCDAVTRTEQPDFDPEFTAWLETDVAEAVRKLAEDPSCVLTSEEVERSIEAEYQRIMASRAA